MTNKPEVVQPIDKKTLSRTHYFQSLLEKAAPMGLIDAADMKRQAIMLAAKLAQRLTFGASTSIKEEAAQGLLESIFYCVSRRLKDMETGEALKNLRQNGVESVWNEGRLRTRGDAERARTLLETVRANSLKTENIAYNETLGEVLESFFRSYDIDFAAHDIPCMMDYFLCIELPELNGAEYVLAYVERLGLENELCAYFGSRVESLLKSACPYWRELNTNIFEVVLTNAMGRVLCGRDALGLFINAEDREKLRASLGRMSKSRLKAVLCAASQRVCSEAASSEELKSYAMRAAGQISERIYYALRTDALEQAFVEFKAPAQKTRFEDSEPMDDEAFRALTDEIRSCRRLSDKLALIRGIRSIKDVEDMLGASCLTEGEYEALFATLGDETLALLYMRLPEEGTLHITEDESEWHTALSGYLEKAGRAERIREVAEGIERE